MTSRSSGGGGCAAYAVVHADESTVDQLWSRVPDIIWEVVAAIRYSSARGEAAVEALATEMGLAADQVKTALDYYGRYPDEIDAEVAENERAAEEASAAWRAQRRLLA